MTTRTRFLLTFALTIVLISASVAHAQQKAADGAILISQSTVIGGLPGDTNGFPITITQPGSYRLTSNIVVPNADTTAILISASHVTLDLNGFAILGPTVCTGADFSSPVTGCSPTGGGVGVVTAGVVIRNVTVRNGTVSGMGAAGVSLQGFGMRVERIHASENGAFGIGITSGVSLHNTAISNGGFGIATSASVQIGNLIRLNQFNGFSFTPRDGFANNVLNENGTNDVGLQTDGNVCGSALCP